jgi:catechol 2,3-dioxygenase-like lactoylglutathione lyase family enzyme
MSGDRVGGITPACSIVIGVGQIVVSTGDLGRLRTFYEGLLGLPHVITLRMAEPPHLRYGVFAVGADTALVAFEVPGHDPGSVGRSGFDHVALRVDAGAFADAHDRLVAAGASDGVVESSGPFLSVRFEDPDGRPIAIVCPNHAFDPTQVADELLECSLPQWTADLVGM